MLRLSFDSTHRLRTFRIDASGVNPLSGKAEFTMSTETEIKIGSTLRIQWEDNPKHGGVKANRANGTRTKKILLPELSTRTVAPKPGEVWVCQVKRITNEKSADHGAIIVKPINIEIDTNFPGVWVDPAKARLMAITLQNRAMNLFLEGPQGAGKTTISRAVAQKLNWEFRKINGAQMKKFNYMLGRYRPKPTGQGTMGFEWVYSKLSRTIKEAALTPAKEFLAFIDEFTRMDEDARDALLDVVEGVERVLSLPTGEELVVPENLHFMAAGNVGDSFTVRKQDAAATDRWVPIEVTYMPPDVELAHCLRKFEHCPRTPMARAIEIVSHIRGLVWDPKTRLSRSVSTRATEKVAMFLAGGIELKVALHTAVANQFLGNVRDGTSERGSVAKTISDAIDNNQKFEVSVK